MANPRKFSGFNQILVGPPGTEDVIRPLPVHHAGTEVISCWELTEFEKQVVAETGLIWVAIQGSRVPPVSITGVPMMLQRNADGIIEMYDVNLGLTAEDIESPFITPPMTFGGDAPGVSA